MNKIWMNCIRKMSLHKNAHYSIQFVGSVTDIFFSFSLTILLHWCTEIRVMVSILTYCVAVKASKLFQKWTWICVNFGWLHWLIKLSYTFVKSIHFYIFDCPLFRLHVATAKVVLKISRNAHTNTLICTKIYLE